MPRACAAVWCLCDVAPAYKKKMLLLLDRLNEAFIHTSDVGLHTCIHVNACMRYKDSEELEASHTACTQVIYTSGCCCQGFGKLWWVVVTASVKRALVFIYGCNKAGLVVTSAGMLAAAP